MDNITVNRIKQLHPKVRPEVSNIYADINAALKGRAICRFAYTIRTFAEQTSLYAQGRTASGMVVTNAKAGQSYHNYGLAIDIVLLKDTNGDGTFDSASWETNVDFDGDGQADWMEIVAVFKRYGWAWGGDFKSIKDKPHFEKTFGYSVSALLQLHKNGKVDAQGYVILP